MQDRGLSNAPIWRHRISASSGSSHDSEPGSIPGDATISGCGEICETQRT